MAGGGTPTPAVSLYRGHVVHVRLRPKAHRFRYGVFSILIDLDRLDDADRASPLFSVDRPNLLSFRERDHGPCDGSPLRAHVEALLRKAGLTCAVGRILLLAYPRYLGFVFNPLAIYCVYASDGVLAAVLYEVRNTFGERHTYVEPVEPAALAGGALRQTATKALRVSPFLGMNARYAFRLRVSGDDLRVHILETDPDGPIFAAGFTARRSDLTSAAVVAASLAMPLMTLKVVAAIHWEALRLWLKGVRIVPETSARRRSLRSHDRDIAAP